MPPPHHHPPDDWSEKRHALSTAATAALPKVMYFVNTWAGVPWGRFKLVYFMSLGLNAKQIGMIRSATHFSKLVAWPLWGALADRLGCIRTTLLISLCCATVALEIMRQLAVRGGYEGSGAHIPVLVVGGVAVVRSSANAGWPLVDAAILALVQRSNDMLSKRSSPAGVPHTITVPPDEGDEEPKENTSQGYGKQRLWGAIAWGLATLFSGMLIDRIGFGSMFYTTYMFVAVEVLVAVVWLPLGLKMAGKPPPPTPIDAEPATGYFAELSRPLVMFYLNMLLYSVIHAIPEQVLIMELERSGVPRTWQGAVSAATVLLEVPVLYRSDRLIGTYGHRHMFIRAQLVCIARLALLMVIPPSFVPGIFAVQMLHGVTFGLVWCAAVPYGQSVAPPGRETLTQTLICTIWGTMGQAIGSIVWGIVYDAYGAEAVYLHGIVLTVFVIAALSYPRVNWQRCCDMEAFTPMFTKSDAKPAETVTKWRLGEVPAIPLHSGEALPSHRR